MLLPTACHHFYFDGRSWGMLQQCHEHGANREPLLKRQDGELFQNTELREGVLLRVLIRLDNRMSLVYHQSDQKANVENLYRIYMMEKSGGSI